MPRAVLLDLLHGRCPSCAGSAQLEGFGSDSRVFLLCGNRYRENSGGSDGPLSSWGGAQVLDSGSTAECLYRFKQTVDELDLSSVTVYTTPRGRRVLVLYQEQLFTHVYTFDYEVGSVDEPACPRCSGSAFTEPRADAVRGEVARFVQGLPALKGEIRVLRSTLIPGQFEASAALTHSFNRYLHVLNVSEPFGHGFSTRTGGVSCLPTLSSMNVFASSKRKDPGPVVQENRRRLGLHAGFHPEPLRLVKVRVCSAGPLLGSDPS